MTSKNANNSKNGSNHRTKICNNKLLAAQHLKNAINKRSFRCIKRMPMTRTLTWFSGFRKFSRNIRFSKRSRWTTFDPNVWINDMYIRAQINDMDFINLFRLDSDNKINKATQLLRKGVDINVINEYKKTALNESCFNYDIESINYLIDNGANVSNCIDEIMEFLTRDYKMIDKKRPKIIEIIDILLYSGAVTTRTERCIVEAQQRAMVLCLFKILYHKFIFLDVNTMFDLVQTLLLDIVPEETIIKIYIMFHNIYYINDIFDMNDIYNIINDL